MPPQLLRNVRQAFRNPAQRLHGIPTRHRIDDLLDPAAQFWMFRKDGFSSSPGTMLSFSHQLPVSRSGGSLQFALALYDGLRTDGQRLRHRPHSSPSKRKRLIGCPQPRSSFPQMGSQPLKFLAYRLFPTSRTFQYSRSFSCFPPFQSWSATCWDPPFFQGLPLCFISTSGICPALTAVWELIYARLLSLGISQIFEDKHLLSTREAQ